MAKKKSALNIKGTAKKYLWLIVIGVLFAVAIIAYVSYVGII